MLSIGFFSLGLSVLSLSTGFVSATGLKLSYLEGPKVASGGVEELKKRFLRLFCFLGARLVCSLGTGGTGGMGGADVVAGDSFLVNKGVEKAALNDNVRERRGGLEAEGWGGLCLDN